MRRAVVGSVLCALLALGPGATAGARDATSAPPRIDSALFLTRDEAPEERSENVRELGSLSYKDATDIDFSGNLVYAARQGEKGGVYIVDVSRTRPRELAFVPCPGTQNDVAFVRPGLIALGFYSGNCGGSGGSGIRLIDVRDPREPRFLDTVSFPDGAHTLTVYPGKPLIYVSPGGLGENGGTEYVVDVSDPANAKVVSTFTPNPFGCHDISFHLTGPRPLAFCPGQLETQILDVSNPRVPEVIAHIPPAMEFPHSAVASPDGTLLVIGDESLFTAHDCVSGTSPLGGLYAYDISDPTNPILRGHISSPRGAAPVGTLATADCTAHNFNFAEGTRKVVASWYTGGTSVIDFQDPSAPREIAHYRPDDADAWSSYFYRGHVFVSDGNRGLAMLRVDGLPPPPPRPQREPAPDKDDDRDRDERKDRDGAGPEPCWKWDAAEREFAEKINQERERRDIPRVRLDPELSRVAQRHSYEMQSDQRLYHTPEETLRRRVTRWEILGENVGVGGSVDSLHRAFMESDEHRQIILYRDFNYVGVGVRYDPDRIWVTVIFEAYEDPGTTMDMPEGC